MFANKLVAVTDRFKKHQSLAGRDIYVIHYFLGKLIKFIEKEVTETTINQDLNPLLLPEKFQKIRKNLKQETLTILKSQNF